MTELLEAPPAPPEGFTLEAPPEPPTGFRLEWRPSRYPVAPDNPPPPTLAGELAREKQEAETSEKFVTPDQIDKLHPFKLYPGLVNKATPQYAGQPLEPLSPDEQMTLYKAYRNYNIANRSARDASQASTAIDPSVLKADQEQKGAVGALASEAVNALRQSPLARAPMEAFQHGTGQGDWKDVEGQFDIQAQQSQAAHEVHPYAAPVGAGAGFMARPEVVTTTVGTGGVVGPLAAEATAAGRVAIGATAAGTSMGGIQTLDQAVAGQPVTPVKNFLVNAAGGAAGAAGGEIIGGVLSKAFVQANPGKAAAIKFMSGLGTAGGVQAGMGAAEGQTSQDQIIGNILAGASQHVAMGGAELAGELKSARETLAAAPPNPEVDAAIARLARYEAALGKRDTQQGQQIVKGIENTRGEAVDQSLRQAQARAAEQPTNTTGGYAEEQPTPPPGFTLETSTPERAALEQAAPPVPALPQETPHEAQIPVHETPENPRQVPQAQAPGVDELPAPGSDAGKEVLSNSSTVSNSSFTTSQGSTYTVNEKGQTTRNKSLHVGHEANDVGPKEQSERTVYVSPESATALGMHGSLSGEKRIIERDGKLFAVSKNAKGEWGIAPSEKNGHEFTTTPEVGKAPVEFWNGGDKWHAGNPITEIKPPAPAAGTSGAVERQGAAEVSKAAEGTQAEPTHYTGISLDEVAAKTGLPKDSPALENTGLPRATDPKPGDVVKGNKVVEVWRTATGTERDGLLHVTMEGADGNRFGATGAEATKLMAKPKSSLKKPAAPDQPPAIQPAPKMTEAVRQDNATITSGKFKGSKGRVKSTTPEGAASITFTDANHVERTMVFKSGEWAKDSGKNLGPGAAGSVDPAFRAIAGDHEPVPEDAPRIIKAVTSEPAEAGRKATIIGRLLHGAANAYEGRSTAVKEAYTAAKDELARLGQRAFPALNRESPEASSAASALTAIPETKAATLDEWNAHLKAIAKANDMPLAEFHKLVGAAMTEDQLRGVRDDFIQKAGDAEAKLDGLHDPHEVMSELQDRLGEMPDDSELVHDDTGTKQEKNQLKKDLKYYTKVADDPEFAASEIAKHEKLQKDNEEAAAKVKTTIGADGSPFKTEKDYEAAQQHDAVKEAAGYIRMAIEPSLTGLYKASSKWNKTDLEGNAIEPPIRGKDFGLHLSLNPIIADDLPTTGNKLKPGGNIRNTLEKHSILEKKATGAADSYELDLSKNLENALNKSILPGTHARFYQALQDAGVAIEGESGDRPTLNGKPAVAFDLRFKPGAKLFVRADVAPEVRNALAIDKPDRPFGAVGNFLTRVQLASGVEAMSHIANQLPQLVQKPTAGGIVAETAAKIHPSLGKAVRVAENLPVLKLAGVLDAVGTKAYRMAFNDLNTKEQVTSLAKAGGLQPPHTGSMKNPFNWLGAGVKGLTNSMRLALDDGFKLAVDANIGIKNTEANRRDYVNQAGNYHRESSATLVRWLKDSGFGPFATAGTARLSQGYRMLAGFAPGVEGSLKARTLMRVNGAAQVAGLLAGVALLNYMRTGKMQPAGTPIGSLYLSTDKDGKPHYEDVADLIGVRGAMRNVGADAALKPGGNLKTALKQAVSTNVGPAFGPIPTFGIEEMTGVNPHGLYQMPGTRGPRDPIANAKEAARQLNPTYAGLTDTRESGMASQFGKFGPRTGMNEADIAKAEKPEKTATLITTLRKNPSDPTAQAELRKLGKAEQDAIRERYIQASDDIAAFHNGPHDEALAKLEQMTPEKRNAREVRSGVGMTSYVADLRARLQTEMVKAKTPADAAKLRDLLGRLNKLK